MYSYFNPVLFQIYFYMPSLANSQYPPIMIPADSIDRPSIAYIDLDLPPPTTPRPSNDIAADLGQENQTRGRLASSASSNVMSHTSTTNNSSTAYKSIDFVRTEAFNRMRHTVEEKYNQNQPWFGIIPRHRAPTKRYRAYFKKRYCAAMRLFKDVNTPQNTLIPAKNKHLRQLQ